MEKHKKIDTKAIEYHIAGILKALGDNPEREGLKDTPKRVAKMYEEVFDGMNYTNEEIADMFNKTLHLIDWKKSPKTWNVKVKMEILIW